MSQVAPLPKWPHTFSLQLDILSSAPAPLLVPAVPSGQIPTIRSLTSEIVFSPPTPLAQTLSPIFTVLLVGAVSSIGEPPLQKVSHPQHPLMDVPLFTVVPSVYSEAKPAVCAPVVSDAEPAIAPSTRSKVGPSLLAGQSWFIACASFKW